MGFGSKGLETSQEQCFQKKRDRNKKLALILIVAASFAVIAGGIPLMIMMQTIKKGTDPGKPPTPAQILDLRTAFNAPDRPVNILLLGLDQDYDRQGRPIAGSPRADTIMLLSMNPDLKRASLISIPRDTKVRVPDHGTDKINCAHAIGGAKLLIRTVEGLMGLPIDGYVETDFQGFIKLIDLAGGVTINVDRDMKYRDKAGGLDININAGVHHFNGEQAMQFARFRHDALGDISRVKRQQELLKALTTSVVAPRNLLKAKSLIETAVKYVETDMSLKQIGATGWFLTHMENGGLETATLPGSFSSLYWLPDQGRINALVRSLASSPASAKETASPAPGKGTAVARECTPLHM